MSIVWADWLIQLRRQLAGSSVSVTWVDIDYTGSNLTDIATRNHDDLQSIQGGTSGQYYHLTSAQHTALNGGNVTALHRHTLTSTIEYNEPTAGFSITAANGTNTLILEPAGTLASGTVTTAAMPLDEQVFTISSTEEITALTVSANSGQTIKGAISTIDADSFASWVYREANTTWYRVA